MNGTDRPSARPFAMAATLAAFAMSPAARAGEPATRHDAAIERAFWDCDARASREALALQDATECAQLTDTIRLRRFDGDFGRFVAWWREQRREAYARRGTAVPGEASVAATHAQIDP